MSTSTTPPPSLTTTFSPADSCTNQLSSFEYVGPEHECFVDSTRRVPCDILHLGPMTSTPACYPPGYEFGRSFYYSPGICPSGYSLACSSVVGKETRGTCCPTWYTCNTHTSEWYWYTTDQCSWNIDATVAYSYVTSTVGGGLQTKVAHGPNGANALGIAIRYKQDDFASETSSTSTSSASTSSTSASSAVHAGPTSSSHSGLSTGATAGIAVGAFVAGLVILGLIVFFALRLRKTAALKQAGPPRPEEQYSEVPGLYGHGKNLPYAEENYRGPAELYDNQSRSELH